MMTSARAASRIGGHRNLLFVPSPTTTTTTHHDQCHGEEQCQENTYKLFSSWKKKTTTMRKQTEEMSPSSNCKRLSTLLFRIHSAPYYCFPLGFAHKDWETKWNWNCVTMKGVLRNMRSQLYSAAEYFELSNMNDDGKEMVMRSLKDYAVKAIANAVDHLGSVSYKVDNLLDYEVDEASVATFEVSCIDQRLRTWQTHIDHEGLSQQSLLIKPPKYHKHYILQGKIPFLFIKFNCNAFITTSQPTADSGKLSMLKCQGFYPPKENSKLNQHQTGDIAFNL
ncbi:hypothetical protein MUK42_14064 [Musa troglodytarum]|uniref:Uncharacterized protein n=1 Tax=Musa troglodytarum TaxID=320322 RepID=A0A9E7GM00_9LILI|nr:hypothetical protein MUK42_14064 [Musa troglodytarum]